MKRSFFIKKTIDSLLQHTRPFIRQLRVHIGHGAGMHVQIEGAAFAHPGRGLGGAFLDEEVVVFGLELDEVAGAQLVLFGPGAAAALEAPAGGGVEREGEEVLGFDEVGDEAAADEEVDEAEDVGGEDEDEDDVEDVLPPLGAARGVVLGSDRGVEALVLRDGEGGDRGGVVPVVDEGRVDGAHEEGGACEHGECFCYRGERRIENDGGRD